MRYMMKSGTLSNPKNGRMLAQIKSSFWGARKTIFLSDDDKQYHTDINILGAPAKKSGNVRLRIFTLNNNNGEVLMEAHPCYAKDDDPDIVGWPICRTPKIDHADLSIGDIGYPLVMHNNQNYSLKIRLALLYCKSCTRESLADGRLILLKSFQHKCFVVCLYSVVT